MFQITQYLQFRNTPNGKPRVLVEGVDYNLKSEEELLYGFTEADLAVELIADLEDTRPLLSVEIEGKAWTEGDIIKVRIGDYSQDTGVLFFKNGIFSFYSFISNTSEAITTTMQNTKWELLGNPLGLEEEKKQRVFKLLNINL